MKPRRFAVALLFVSACQTYDFERVVPFAVRQTTQHEIFAGKRLKPNVMLLVDNSGSMQLPTDPTDARCPAGCGTGGVVCPATCRTRVSEMKSAMTQFLASQSTNARFGLTYFPASGEADAACAAPTTVKRALPVATRNDEGTDATLALAASEVSSDVAALNPQGGTPTAGALQYVSTLPALNDLEDGRLDLVLLLTDGLPNCGGANANQVCDCFGTSCSAARLSSCACTLSNCTTTQWCSKGCLDSDDSVQAVKALFQKNILTAVVGFGADVTNGDGPRVLKAMADEGGFGRTCPNGTSAECGGSACDAATGRCVQSFFAARNATELATALEDISRGVRPDKACVFNLSEKPDEQGTLAVLVDGRPVLPGDGTWTLSGSAVTFHDALCAQLTSSTPLDPVKLEFLIANRL